MNAFNRLRNAWVGVEARFMSSQPIRRLTDGSVGVEHYASYLRETYFYTRENPQIQAVATAWFRGADRQMVQAFLKHALSEVGHDHMALNDMAALGYDVSCIPDENPLPTTVPLISFPYYAIQYRSPISYLGYLFFLEFLPTSRGRDVAAAIAALGVPAGAMTFLREHQNVDVQHNRFMEQYAQSLLSTADRVAEAVYAMEVTGRLFTNLLDGAFEAADSTAAASARKRA